MSAIVCVIYLIVCIYHWSVVWYNYRYTVNMYSYIDIDVSISHCVGVDVSVGG